MFLISAGIIASTQKQNIEHIEHEIDELMEEDSLLGACFIITYISAVIFCLLCLFNFIWS